MSLCTKNTTYQNGQFLGTGDNVTIVDTPGFDLLNEDHNNFMEQMFEVLNENIETVNAFIIMIKGSDHENKFTRKFSSGMINLINFLQAAYGKEIWMNIIIVVSFWSYSRLDILERLNRYQTEEALIHHWNIELKETFNINHDVPVTFIDSRFVIQTIKEEERQEKFKAETAKLLKFIKETEPAKLLKRQKRELHDQVESLKDVMSTNISEINDNFKGQLFELEGKMENLEKENSEFQQTISNLKTDLDQKMVTFQH